MKTDTHSHAHLCTKHFEKHCDMTTLLKYIHKYYHDYTFEICICGGALTPPAPPSELPLIMMFLTLVYYYAQILKLSSVQSVISDTSQLTDSASTDSSPFEY